MSDKYVLGAVGTPPTQYMNSLGIGFDNNQYTGNKILPLNYSGVGGRKRGGSFAGILGTAATPLTLLALQNQYGRKNILSRGNRRRKSRRSRRSRRSRKR